MLSINKEKPMLSINSRLGPSIFSTISFARLIAILAALMVSPGLASVAAASELEAVTISAQKPLGPVPGTFETSGAFSDSGIFLTEQRIVSAIPSPFGVVSHLLLRFEGHQGTFWIRTQIMETATEDANIFANDGVWVIVNGTGAYSTLQGNGDIEGTVDDEANLITRVFAGLVHFR